MGIFLENPDEIDIPYALSCFSKIGMKAVSIRESELSCYRESEDLFRPEIPVIRHGLLGLNRHSRFSESVEVG